MLSYDPPSVGGLADADQGQIPVAMFSLIGQESDRYGAGAPAWGRCG